MGCGSSCAFVIEFGLGTAYNQGLQSWNVDMCGRASESNQFKKGC